MEILRITTAGSVDDGKSTLIGRLLYETQSLKTDQVETIEAKSKSLGYDYIDFSLATDGLLTEREQGITIDVSHLYFSTPKRRFIIADAPGHVEYTRNMVTGASNVEVGHLQRIEAAARTLSPYLAALGHVSKRLQQRKPLGQKYWLLLDDVVATAGTNTSASASASICWTRLRSGFRGRGSHVL